MNELNKQAITANDAYSLTSPEDNRRLYARWAETYDEDFIRAEGYIYHQEVAAIFFSHFRVDSGPVLDVGCGTGIVGTTLRELGLDVIDGIDISPEMLKVAGRAAHNGNPVYRGLIEADLTQAAELTSNVYAGLISVGTFTHGHLGPNSINELVRVCSPGAVATIGIKAEHFSALGFEHHLDGLRNRGDISNYELAKTNIYAATTGADGAVVATFEVLGT